MSLGLNDVHHRNQLASDWMHRGMDLANENSETALEQAVRCFDEAIALRRTLPLEDVHFFRYGLSAGWINRGDAMVRMGGRDMLVEAVKSYDEALALLESLVLEENALYPRRLSIAWINRGIALQKQAIDGWEVVKCFREAIKVLESLPAAAVTDRESLLAGAWINLAGALVDLKGENIEGVLSAARHAIALAKNSERTDIRSYEVGLKARHLLCRLAVKEILAKRPLSKATIAETTDAVDESMVLARHWKLQGGVELLKLVRDIFRFGCRIYETGQPHFLAEFLMEYLVPETLDEMIFPDQEIFDTVQAAIWGVLEQLQLNGFQFVGTDRFEPFLSDIEELRKVEERLAQLRRSYSL